MATLNRNFFISFISFIIILNLKSLPQIIAWDTNGLAGDEATLTATTVSPNLNPVTLVRGSGIEASKLTNSFSSDYFSTNGTKTDAISNYEYIEFQISSKPEYKFSLSTLDANFRRSSKGPNTFQWQFSLDGFITSTDISSEINFTTSPSAKSQEQIDLSSFLELQDVESDNIITFRLYGWGATISSGSFAIGNLSGNDLSIEGTISSIPILETKLINLQTTYTFTETGIQLTFNSLSGSGDVTVKNFLIHLLI